MVAIRIWLDDERPMPPFFNCHVRTANEAIKKLKEEGVTCISLDHDLGDGNKTGYDVAKYIEEAAYSGELKRITLMVHTHSKEGRINICNALRNAKKFWMDKKIKE